MRSFGKFLFRFCLLLGAAALAVCFHTPLKEGWKKLTGEIAQPTQATAALEDADAALEEDWETLFLDGVSYYAYQQLDEDEQTAYCKLYVALMNMEESAEITSMDMEELDIVYSALLMDHPEIFWTDGYSVTSYMLGNVVQSLTVEPVYTCSETERDEKAAQVEAKAEQIVQEASALYTEEYGRVRYVYETIIRSVEYDAENENNQNICSVFLEGRSVCMGYAKAFQYLLQKLEIECTVVSGQANGETHAWDLVYMDGAYYYVDPTWGDVSYSDPETQRDTVNYVYFGMTTESLLRTHTIDSKITLPECTATTDNYYVREGLLFSEFNADVIGNLITQTRASGASEVSFCFANDEGYAQAYAYLIRENRVFDYLGEGQENVSYREDADYQTLTIYF